MIFPDKSLVLDALSEPSLQNQYLRFLPYHRKQCLAILKIKIFQSGKKLDSIVFFQESMVTNATV